MKNWKAIGSSRFAVVGALLLVGMLWGSSFPLVAVAAPTLGAVGTTHGRFIVAALVLALITASSRSTWRAVGHRFPAFLLLAALNVAGPLTLVATAIVGLNSSTASILNATTPMFTVFVAAFWLRQKITWRKLSGVAIGIVGVSVLVGGIPSAIDSRAMLAIGASLTAALLYAVGGVYARKSFQDTPPLTLALGQQLAAVALLVPVSAVAPPPGPITVGPLIAVVALGLGATAGGYLVYFWIIRQAGPVAASAVTLLVPISASAIGVLWLHEPVTFALVGGLVVILAGVGLLLDLPPTRDPSRRVAPDRAASADKRPVSG
ncbi:DMT family transporter [Rhodococcus erythropolis]|nr:DMT family transporter [Rhodococcus erythropolis]